PEPLAEDGPQRDRAGLGGRLLVVPAARRDRRGALQGARARDPAPVRRDRPGRRPGRHDHRRRDPAGGGAGLMEHFGHIIDGAERESLDGARFDSVDPYTQETWATVALGGAPEADLAVAAARTAFDEGPWPRMGFAERGALIHRLADLIMEHVDELAMADTR